MDRGIESKWFLFRSVLGFKINFWKDVSLIIGIPKEVKVREYRVGVVPAGVVKQVDSGHQGLVQPGAGIGSGLNDQSYYQAGAQIVASAEEIYGRSKLIVKVKEPDESEIELIQENQILIHFYTFKWVLFLSRNVYCIILSIFLIYIIEKASYRTK